jgi:LmbE family N-acetylglucosaminyl deacetylase
LVLAHPDDETFFAGGAIAKYAAEGADVAIVCGTRGERGSTGNLCSIEDLPRVREAELHAAARELGVAGVEVLPYEDQKLWTAPADTIRRQIVAAVRRTRPQVVITFDPNGANEHTDHIVISRFALDAISAAADARWYPEAGPPHQTARVVWQSPVLPFELGRVPDPAQQPGVDFLIDVGAFRERKAAAITAHGTQLPGLKRIYLAADRRETALLWEAFRMGFGPAPPSVPAADLFAGIEQAQPQQ